jgi:dinuclear metal center YbgI/SA1388 family protein
MTVHDVLAMIDAVAPFDSQEEWDNCGLLLGSPRQEITGILFALDVTEQVIDEAVRLGVSLIVTHHPLMFSPVRRITDDDYEGRLITRMLENRISLIAAHTNLDRAADGINDVLAALCGLSGISGTGFFRAGILDTPVSARNYAEQLGESLSTVVRIYGPAGRMVKRIGLCSGGGGDSWPDACAAGCDAFVTGEIHHHVALAAVDSGLVVFECGHFATEEPGIRALAQALQNSMNTLKCNVGVYISEIPAYSFPQQP